MIAQLWKISSKNYPKKSKNWLLDILAKNRGLTTKEKIQSFLNPNITQIVNAELTDLKKAVDRVQKAIKNKEKIIVYSDYDADGICASAIVWETLFDLSADILPYVPHRITEGYGLSTSAIDTLFKKGANLIITVDHGVTAVKQVEHAKKLGIDVIITDHHLKPKNLPKPQALVHTTQLCGGGVAWRFCAEIVKALNPSYKEKLLEKLELAAIATIADLVPLVGANRAIVKIGLEKLNNTTRPGIKSLIKTSALTYPIDANDIGHVIAPRINAMGRIEHGIDSLRLLCSKNLKQAEKLAQLLSTTNTKRQGLTIAAIDEAHAQVKMEELIVVINSDKWHEGIIGLVASRVAETQYRPTIAISKGPQISKGSARSIAGFNIVEAIRSSSEYLIDAGGHPMAAGFSIKTQHIEAFTKSINVYAQKNLSPHLLKPSLTIECELDQEDINFENLDLIKTFEPFGVGNPRPLFLTKKLLIEDIKPVGRENRHLKLLLSGKSAIGFNMGAKRYDLRPGNLLDVVYSIDEDNFNGKGKVQMKVKDFRRSDS